MQIHFVPSLFSLKFGNSLLRWQGEKVLAVLGGLSGIPFPIVVNLANALSVYGERPLKYLCGIYVYH